MTVFGMVTTERSQDYTVPALASFFRHTRLGPEDRFLLIDNDATFDLSADFPRVELVRRERRAGFAANVNLAMARAAEGKEDLVFLNNDVIFTPGWLEPLRASDRAILVPLCNQDIPYEHGALALRRAMDWDEYAGREDELDAIARAHGADPRYRGHFLRGLHVGFYCFRLPGPVHAAVGAFDEAFGFGGGEDIDYRIRANLAGFDVALAMESYLLHFRGKSTWRGGESAVETQARNLGYVRHFVGKWGAELAGLFLFGNSAQAIEGMLAGSDLARLFPPPGRWERHVADLGLEAMAQAGDYRGLIAVCLARRQPQPG